MAQHNELGKWGENMAAQYLIDKGYAIRHRDWKSGRRDIDIVAVTPDGSTLAFVEVKTRRDRLFSEPEHQRHIPFHEMQCRYISPPPAGGYTSLGNRFR